MPDVAHMGGTAAMGLRHSRVTISIGAAVVSDRSVMPVRFLRISFGGS
ncbi:hypothetical protein GSbR_31490 [Geobacter sp. SVR]|nr:hypothetical protein GSVR_04020 [Geobacter sp. SVR]GCF86549.1 hypothetical protein GSbR_31490 [Geobacter sp. SVR]